MKKSFFKLSGLFLILGGLTLSSCGDSNTDDGGNKPKPPIHVDTTTNTVGPLSIGGQVFVIPSPIQTADLIKKSTATFNANYLNPTESVSNYNGNFKKALNMGIYGADLGYLAVYNMTDKTASYLKSVRTLANEIGLGNAFNDKLAAKVSESMGDEDKMLSLVSEAYKTADDYLKENQKDNIAALVIVGGWLESVSFACGAAKETNDPAIIERVADQKNVLKTILAMLKQYREDEDYDDLAISLEDLNTIFNGIKFSYEFVDPVTDESAKTTKIACKHNVTITPEQVEEISAAVEEIRNEIIL